MSGGSEETHGLQVKCYIPRVCTSASHPISICDASWCFTSRSHQPAAACKMLEMNISVLDASTHTMQETGEHFIAGVLGYLPGIMAFLAASPNSYRRIAPSHWTGAFQVPTP